MMAAYVHFIHPGWVWAGAVAAGVPLLAHLLSDRGGPRVVFPTIRFLSAAVAGRARWLRPRQWLVLAWRSALLMLIAVAFARPVWQRTGDLAGPGDPTVVAMVLDRSASMNRFHRGATLFDEARRRVTAALRGLDPASDKATVILLDATPRPLLPEASANFDRLIELVAQTRSTHQRGDLDAALHLATEHTQWADRRGAGGRSRTDAPVLSPTTRTRIEIFTDMQQTQFPDDWDASLASKRTSVRIHAVAGEAGNNVAVFEPVMSPVRPVVGQTATFTVRLACFDHGQAPRQVRLRMVLEDHVQIQAVTLRPGAVQTIAWAFTPSRPGPTFAQWQIEQSDALDSDNRVGLCFSVAMARRVALASDADAGDSRSATYYLARALVPGQAQHGGAGVDLRVWPRRQIAQQLADPDPWPAVVVIAEAGGWTQSALSALYQYLVAGGGVVWMVDSPEAVEALRRFSRLDPDHPLGPVVPRGDHAWVTGGDFRITSGQFDDPVLTVFDGPSRRGLMEISFGAVMMGSPGPQAQSLLDLADGTPVLACRWIGAGRLAVLGANLSPDQSNFVKSPLFLPVVHQLVRNLAPGPPAPAPVYAGGQARLWIEDVVWPQELIGCGPAQERVSLTLAENQVRSAVVQMGPLDGLGRYTVTRTRDGAVMGSVWVGIDPAESDLRVADRPVLATGQTPTGGVGGSDSLHRHGLELWPYLIGIAALMTAVEPLFVTLGSLAGFPMPWRAKESPGHG